MFWPWSSLPTSRPPMPWHETGQSSISQQHSSIWWIRLSTMWPEPTHNRVDLAELELLEQNRSILSPWLPIQRRPPRRLARMYDELAHLAAVDLVDQRGSGGRMAALQTGRDLHALLLGFFAGAEHPVQAHRIAAKTVSP